MTSMPGRIPRTLSEEREWRKFIWKWMGLSLLLHLLTAWFSQGYHSADEYFQILEFLNYKVGGTPVQHLAVEFPERMRPWMQPYLYFCLIKIWKALGVTSPFTWAFSFRVFTGLIGWASTFALALRSSDWFESERARRFCVMACALLWFLPSLHVRPSSESLSGSCFFLGLALTDWLATHRPGLMHRRWEKPFTKTALWVASGLLLGLSFEARFQSGLLIAGLGLWLLLRARVGWRPLTAMTLGFAILFTLGRWIDRWGYGEWVMSPWRYVEYNLIRGEVNRFGHAPWWDVFRMSFTESWPFIGTALVLATLVAWIRHPFHILTWSLVPFFLVHEIIAHKELRFFFPIAMAGPALLTLSLLSRKGTHFLDPVRVRGVKWFWRFLEVNNWIALIALCFVPYSRTAQFYQGVARLIPPGAARFEIYYQGRDPYLVLGNPVFFYRPPQIVTTPFTSYDELVAKLKSHPTESVWVFSQKFELPTEASALAGNCHAAYRTLPVWVKHINLWNWLDRTNAWTLFECRSNTTGS